MKPILMSTDMVKAVLNGTKTQTRRTTGLNKINENPKICKYEYQEHYKEHEFSFYDGESNGTMICKSPYGSVGDKLWVREAFFAYGEWQKNGISKTGKQKWRFIDSGKKYEYMDLAGACPQKNSFRQLAWYKRNSIHMPFAACRIWLEITDIRIERLCDISEEDAIAEGVEKLNDKFGYNSYDPMIGYPIYMKAKESFRTLIESLQGEEIWNKNPWVWVVEFKTIKL